MRALPVKIKKWRFFAPIIFLIIIGMGAVAHVKIMDKSIDEEYFSTAQQVGMEMVVKAYSRDEISVEFGCKILTVEAVSVSTKVEVAIANPLKLQLFDGLYEKLVAPKCDSISLTLLS